MKHDENAETLQKELANAYKRIKMYEYEIGKIEDSQGSGSVSQK